jgi:MoaA/NifB/PqqE/SkfB family radical SAM enzyme
MINKSVIFTWYACNAKCIFCIDLNKRQINASTKTIFENIIQAKKNGTNYLEIIGGEITIRRDFFMMLAFAKKVGFDTIMFVTNGIKFADKDFCKRVLDMNIVDHIVFSIHSHNPELHDELVAHRWAHAKLMKWISNLRELGFNKIGINNTIISQNFEYLPDFVEFLHENNFDNVETIFADPNQWWVNNEFDKLMPRIRDVAPYAREAIRRANAYKMIFRIRYVPLCHFKEFIETDNISEVMEVRTFKTAHIAPDFQNYNVSEWRKSVWRIKPDKCRPCKYYNLCEWIWTTYYEKLWDDELSPIL